MSTPIASEKPTKEQKLEAMKESIKAAMEAEWKEELKNAWMKDEEHQQLLNERDAEIAYQAKEIAHLRRQLKENIVKETREDFEEQEDPDEPAISEVSANVTRIEMADLFQATTIRLPKLKDLEKESIRLFIRDDEEYRLACPLSMQKKPQKFVRKEQMKTLMSNARLSNDEIMAVSGKEFLDSLCAMHEVLNL